MADIFISYAQEDTAIVEALARNLEREGFDVWWARHLVPVGDLDSIVRQEIEASKAVIVIWSRDSIKSGWVQGEAILGRAKNALVCVTVPDNLPEFGIPAQFLSLPRVPVLDIDRIVAAVEKLGAKPKRIDDRLRTLLSKLPQRICSATSLP